MVIGPEFTQARIHLASVAIVAQGWLSPFFAVGAFFPSGQRGRDELGDQGLPDHGAHWLRHVAQYYQLLSDATLTNTEVTDESVTAFAQYCRLLSSVTLTNTEVTDVSATAFAQCCRLLSGVTVTNT